MNFETKFKEICERQVKLAEQIADLKNAYADAEDFTRRFLNECESRGIEVVSIQRKTNLIPSSEKFPFGTEHSVFAPGKYGGWPAIWRVCETLGIGGGAGNSDQHQISPSAAARLVDGVYTLKDGVWHREE